MSVKHLLPIALVAIVCTSASAQTLTTYYNNKGKQVYSPDSVDYIRTVAKIDTTTAMLFSVIERYKNGNIKCKGVSKVLNYNVWEGAYADFYPSGNKKTEATYVNNSLRGDYLQYYPNGLLYCTKKYISQYFAANKNSVGRLGYRYLIKSCSDSTGKPILTDGNGHYIGYTNEFKKVFEQGDVKDGERTGHWTGKSDGKDSIQFEEDYDNGKLIKGISHDKDGKVYAYNVREINPEYDGGEQAFGLFLRNNIHYPAYAKARRVTGRVFVQFVIEKDGTLTDIKAVRAPSADLAEESIRVLKLSPKWIAGIQYGRPVRVEYTVPINYSLAY